MVGSGKNAREVTVMRFNAAEVEQLRGVLADLGEQQHPPTSLLAAPATPRRSP